MDNKSDFEAYLYISQKKLNISVIQINNLKIVYEKESIIENNLEKLDFNKLQIFLDSNILKLEKFLKHFIKNVFIILDTKDFLPINLSIKNNNSGNVLNLENLFYSLNQARYQCKKTTEHKKIIHTIIQNYQIDDENYSSLPKNLKCNNFSLDIKFICLSNNMIKDLENSLEQYQISISQIISLDYIGSFFDNIEDLPIKARQITNGCNPNEVKFNDKSPKNEGFFEKFFNFFN